MLIRKKFSLIEHGAHYFYANVFVFMCSLSYILLFKLPMDDNNTSHAAIATRSSLSVLTPLTPTASTHCPFITIGTPPLLSLVQSCLTRHHKMFVGREAKTMSPCLLVTQPVHDAIPDNAQYFFTSLTICAEMHLQTMCMQVKCYMMLRITSDR